MRPNSQPEADEQMTGNKLHDSKINFVTFEDAVELAKKEQDVEFIGMKFEPLFKHLGVYSVVVRSDEPEEVSIMYEGGQLFSSCGEEDFTFWMMSLLKRRNCFTRVRPTSAMCRSPV